MSVKRPCVKAVRLKHQSGLRALRCVSLFINIGYVLPDPLSLGGKPVCCVRMRPLTGEATADVLEIDVEFLRRALWYVPSVNG